MLWAKLFSYFGEGLIEIQGLAVPHGGFTPREQAVRPFQDSGGR
jgi:hypothetical protein